MKKKVFLGIIIAGLLFVLSMGGYFVIANLNSKKFVAPEEALNESFDENPLINAHVDNPNSEPELCDWEKQVDTHSLRSVLDTYFYKRATQFTESSCNAFPFAEESVNNVFLNRMNAIRIFKENIHSDIINNRMTYNITSETFENGIYTVKAKDSNQITYREDGQNNSEKMGFYIEHVLKIRFSDSSYTIIEDVYDERPLIDSHYGEVYTDPFNPIPAPEISVNTASPENVLDAYFKARSMQFSLNSCLALPYVADSVNAAFFNRFHKMPEFRETLVGTMESIDTTYRINSQKEESGHLIYEIFEWNKFYILNSADNQLTTKEFGATHVLTLSKENGAYYIEEDVYNENPNLDSQGTEMLSGNRALSSYNPISGVNYALSGQADGTNLTSTGRIKSGKKFR